MAAIDINHKTFKEKKNTVAVMTTDLSAAFDLVDHNLLIEKLKFYGLQNEACTLLENFLKDRKVYTQIQGFNSDIEAAQPCSVIQGSKLSGFLFTLFSIEIPLIPKLMRNAQLIELLMEIKIPQFYGVLHEVNQYVEDSMNLIGSNTKEEMEKYLESYHKVIETYYSANKLKINSDKTQLIITRKKWKDKTDEKVKFKTKEGDSIREVNALRVLGFIKNNRDSYDSHLGQVNGRVVKTLAELKPYTKHMDQNTRKEIIYLKVTSIALYGYELFTGQTERTTSKFT